MKPTTPYKLMPGSEEAQAIELLRFLPAGTALNACELRARLGWAKSKGVCQKLVVPVKRGALRAEKRFDEAAGYFRTYWSAGARPAVRLPHPLPTSMSYSPAFGGFAFSRALRAQARPNASTLAQTAGGRYMALRSSFSSSGFGGRPRFFASSMGQIVVPRKRLAITDLRCHNKGTDNAENDMAIKQGDKVKFKPEWQDAGDEEITFVALEDEDGGRVRIGAVGVLTRFVPTQIVLTSMLEGQQ